MASQSKCQPPVTFKAWLTAKFMSAELIRQLDSQQKG